jgi:hypothetical protein
MEIEIRDEIRYFPTEQSDAALLALTLLGYTKIPETQFVEKFSSVISDDRFTISVDNRFFYRPLTEISPEGARTGFLRVLEMHNSRMDVKFYNGTSILMSESLTLKNIPVDLYGTIAINLNIDDINYLCLTNREFKKQICDNNFFWRQKFVNDYGPAPNIEADWKKLYREERQVVVFDDEHPTGVDIKLKAVKIVGGITSFLCIIDDQNRLVVKYKDFTTITNIKVRDIGTPPSLSKSLYVITMDMKVLKVKPAVKDRIKNIVGEPYDLPPAKSIYSKGRKLAVIDIHDNLWTSGLNRSGELGLGLLDQKIRKPMQVGMKAKMVAIGTDYTAIIGLDDYVYISGKLQMDNLNVNQNTPYKTDIRAKMIVSYLECLGVIDMENRLHLYGSHFMISLMRRSINKIDKQVKYASIGHRKLSLIDIEDNVWVMNAGFGLHIRHDLELKPLGMKAYQIVGNDYKELVIRKSF